MILIYCISTGGDTESADATRAASTLADEKYSGGKVMGVLSVRRNMDA